MTSLPSLLFTDSHSLSPWHGMAWCSLMSLTPGVMEELAQHLITAAVAVVVVVVVTGLQALCLAAYARCCSNNREDEEERKDGSLMLRKKERRANDRIKLVCACVSQCKLLCSQTERVSERMADRHWFTFCSRIIIQWHRQSDQVMQVCCVADGTERLPWPLLMHFSQRS